MESVFNIYSWINQFEVDEISPRKLIDDKNWLRIILKLVPSSQLENICQDNIYFEIPKLKERMFRLTRLKLSELQDLRKNNLTEYVKLAKEIGFKKDLTPNTLSIVIEDGKISESPITELNPLIKEDLKICPTNLILILVRIIRISNQKVKSVHVNSLIIDQKRQIYELFDPYGETSSLIDDWFDSKFKSFLGLSNYQYLSPMLFCPTKGPQHLAEKTEKIERREKGCCYTYTLMYIQMRLSNPELTAEKIVKFLMKSTGEELRKYANIYNTILHEYYGWPYREESQ